jgi:CheY-like chemotaxis protein
MIKEPDGGAKELRILLVEDHPDDALLTLLALKKQNIENIVIAGDALQALEYLLRPSQDRDEDSELPGLIIVDLKLPKMDGFDLIETIRKHEEFRDIPVVVLSASNSEKDRERCSDLGVNGYFTKPLDATELARMLDEKSVS